MVIHGASLRGTESSGSSISHNTMLIGLTVAHTGMHGRCVVRYTKCYTCRERSGITLQYSPILCDLPLLWHPIMVSMRTFSRIQLVVKSSDMGTIQRIRRGILYSEHFILGCDATWVLIRYFGSTLDSPISRLPVHQPQP